MRIKNNRFVTSVLSVLLPRADQLLKGHGHKTLLGYSIFFLLPILFFTFKLQYHFQGLIGLSFCFVVLYVLNVVDAFFGKEEYSVNDSEAIVVPGGMKPLYIYWAKDKTRIGKIVE